MSVCQPAGGAQRQMGTVGLDSDQDEGFARWLKPMLIGQFEFREWTPDNHVRHSRFVALRDDKKASEVKREMKT